MTPRIHRRGFGSGPRQLLAIHCSLAHSGAWRGLAAAMGSSVTVQAFDLPNHGQSGDWDGSGDLHDAATDMARAVLDDMGPGPHDVIGHSFGATVALRLMVECPERIARAVLYEPVFFAAAIADDPGFASRYATVNDTFEAAYAAGRHEEAARAFNRHWAGAGTWSALPEKTRAYMTERIGFVHHSTPSLIEDCCGLLAPGRLGQAHAPVLLMKGALSPWAGEINAALAHRLPNATEVTVPDVGHMAPVTEPDAVAPAIRRFLGL